MANVTFHVPIRKGYHGENWLMETVYDLDFLPDVGEWFHPLKNDPESGLSMEVRKRWWDEHGDVQIETHSYIMDPEEEVTAHYRGIYRGWNIENDGHLPDMLKANGWWEYGGIKPALPVKPADFQEAVELIHNGLLIQQYGVMDPHLPMTRAEWDSAAESFLRRNR